MFQIQVATKSRHPNLVSLIGVCPNASAAIYEYLPNGSLEDQLGARDSSNHLSWQTRIHICADTCAALMFLHSCYGMVHGDLKPGNILLDSNFVAKITNFGLCSAQSHSPTTGELSFASDIYSFGNVLLRLLTGRSALNLDEVMQTALDLGNLSVVLDPTAGNWPFEQAKELAHLALSCRDSDSNNRPCLRSQVWPVLERMRNHCEASLSSRSGPEEPGQPPQYFTCPISHVSRFISLSQHILFTVYIEFPSVGLNLLIMINVLHLTLRLGNHGRSSCGCRWFYLRSRGNKALA